MSKVTNRVEASYTTPTATHHHFSSIAQRYHYLRITDSEPITLIAKELRKLSHIEAIDIGCGTGRYDLLLCRHLDGKLSLTCSDANADMLEMLGKYLNKHGICNCISVHATAENPPSPDNTYDCMCTFNAIHHFNLPEFLHESARILKSGGYLFIYTRLREQNERNIWGRYFPRFHQQETRLYDQEILAQSVTATPKLWIKSIEHFQYGRTSTLAQLIERASSHHYSTSSLYSPEELEEAVAGFEQNIRNEFEDTRRIRWLDENILFVIRKNN